MNKLSAVLMFKIIVTMAVWSAPLILLPESILIRFVAIEPGGSLFIQLLGWAYLCLCVGYALILKDSLKGKIQIGPICVGILSNAGASAILFWHGISGSWAQKGLLFNTLASGSTVTTLAIPILLYHYGIRCRSAASAT